MSYYTRCGKKVYFTKCGKKFVKATNAETTGFTCKTNEYGELTEECGACGFTGKLKRKANISPMSAELAVNRLII